MKKLEIWKYIYLSVKCINSLNSIEIMILVHKLKSYVGYMYVHARRY